jgi:hypothetical protein
MNKIHKIFNLKFFRILIEIKLLMNRLSKIKNKINKNFKMIKIIIITKTLKKVSLNKMEAKKPTRKKNKNFLITNKKSLCLMLTHLNLKKKLNTFLIKINLNLILNFLYKSIKVTLNKKISEIKLKS